MFPFAAIGHCDHAAQLEPDAAANGGWVHTSPDYRFVYHAVGGRPEGTNGSDPEALPTRPRAAMRRHTGERTVPRRMTTAHVPEI